MLQQTTVATVRQYYERFLETFPTIAALAAAPEQHVLRLWEGLGYYRRARHLHQAAQVLNNEHDGRLPDDPAIVAGLPGVGRYILGATLSQAFDRRLPILEANSRRVLCRLFGKSDDPTTGPMQRWLWDTAERFLPTRRVGDFNQALMELGATVCTPTTPKCDGCPLASMCVANRDGLQAKIPAKSPRAPITQTIEVAVVIWKNDQLLIVQRPAHERWAGLWEFPHGEVHPGEPLTDAAARIARELTQLSVAVESKIRTIRHAVTRYRVTMHCLIGRHVSGTFGSEFYPRGMFARMHDLALMPLSSPHRRLVRALGGDDPRASMAIAKLHTLPKHD
jgi:A/G-specific adenine glycosylase